MTSSLLFALLLCGLGFSANAYSHPAELITCKSCPPGWTWYGGYCYRFVATERDWYDSERFCNSMGANLESLETKGEYEFIKELVYRSSGFNKPAWVGGCDAVKEGFWFWSDGTPFTFNGWGPGEPNDYSENENCMMINTNGDDFVSDASCSRKLASVCARSP